MSTKIKFYALVGCILAAAVVFAVCENRKKAPSRHSSSGINVVNNASAPAAQGDNNAKDGISDSDCRGLEQAMTNYFSAMDDVGRQLTNAQDAGGTVKVIESWTAANNNYATAMDAFANRHPQVTQGTLPPKLVDIFSRFKERNQKYASLPGGLNELIDRFDSDPQVTAAEVKFRVSLEYFRN